MDGISEGSRQMSVIEQAEQAIIERILDVLPRVLRDSGTLPGGWTLDMLKRALQFAPGVYVAFTNGNVEPDRVARINAKFEVYVVTREPVELNRRAGNNVAIGAYEIIDRVVAGLFNYPVKNVGTLQFNGVNNLFRDVMFSMGGTVYGLSYTLPLSFDTDVQPVPDDFLKFHVDYDIMPFTRNLHPTWLVGDRTEPDAPDAQDRVLLQKQEKTQ